MTRLGGWMVAVLGLVALIASGWWLVRPDDEAAEEEAGRGFVLPVTLSELERGDVLPRALLSGTVRASRRAQLGFDAKGLIRELVVAEGDRVEADQVLGHIKQGDQEYELAAAQAALALAEREQELLLAGEREEEKRRLEAVLDAAMAEAELARLEVERSEKLIEDKIISQSEQDQRAAEFRAADKRRVAAEEEYGRALAGTRAEDLAIAEARVAEAKTRVETAMHRLRKTELRAPWTGSVVERFVSVGDYVSEGEPVFELVDLENLEIHVEIPGRFAPRLGPSTRVHVSLSGEDGNVLEKDLDTTIAAADESARSFRGIVRFGAAENPDSRLKPGMFVEAVLLLEPVRDALVLPSDCVLAGARGTFVVRALPGEAAGDGPPGLVADFVPVRVLAQADARSAIESLGAPLSAGDQIVLTGADNAFPGAALLPRGAGPPGMGHGEEGEHPVSGEEGEEVAQE